MKDGLSKRQIEVVRLYGDGLSTKEIAYKLRIGDRTVEYHRNQVKSTMKLKTFADIIKLAVGFGLTSLCLMIHAGVVPILLSWNNLNSPQATNVGMVGVNGVNIYYTTNLSLPTNQWPLLVFLTNAPPGSNGFTTNLTPGFYFFIAEFTNTFWKQSLPFSNGAATPPLPTNLLTSFSVLNL